MKTNVLNLAKNILFLLLTAFSAAHAGESEIRQSIQSKFPTIGKLEHIVKTPYAGLYEIVINNQLMYTDESGQYLFDGSIIEIKTRTNLTEPAPPPVVCNQFRHPAAGTGSQKSQRERQTQNGLFHRPQLWLLQET